MNGRNNPGLRLIVFSLIVSLVTTVAGCAVLNVEVDVYKGPLANHDEIQLEQIAAMAVAAKPLLHELSYQLESKWLNENCCGDHECKDYGSYEAFDWTAHTHPDATVTAICEQISYQSKKNNPYIFIDPGIRQSLQQNITLNPAVLSGRSKGINISLLKKDYVYGSPEARKIQALLELYEERSGLEKRFKSILEKAQEIDDIFSTYLNDPPKDWSKYEKNLKSSVIKDLESCPAVWGHRLQGSDEKGAAKEQDQSKDTAHNPSIEDEKSFDIHLKDKNYLHFQAHKTLICGYREFFNPQAEPFWRLSRTFQRKLLEDARSKSNSYSQFLSTNGTFLWLSEEKNVREHADIFFGKCSKGEKTAEKCISKKFAKEVSSLARSFVDSRAQVHSLYSYALHQLSSSNATSEKDLQKALINLVMEFTDPTDVLMTVNSLDLIHKMKISNDELTNIADQIKASLTYSIFDELSSCKFDPPFLVGIEDKDSEDICDTKWNSTRARANLRYALETYPVRTAKLLINLDYYLIIVSSLNEWDCFESPNEQESCLTYLLAKGSNEHVSGLVVGPNEVFDSVKNGSYFSAAEQLLASIPLGLESGRRNRGINDQIEKFLKARDNVNLNERSSSQYDGYSDSYINTKRKLLNSLEEFAQKLLVIANNAQLFDLENLGDQSTTFKLMLQTVGNSIINYSNHITYSDAHKNRAALKVDSEIRSYKHAHQIVSYRVGKSFKAFIDEKKTTLSEANKDNQTELSKINLVYETLNKLSIKEVVNTDNPLAYFEGLVGQKIDSSSVDDGVKVLMNEWLSEFVLEQLSLRLSKKVVDSADDPRQVIDSLITTLQYQLLHAKLVGDKARETRLTETIAESYRHRAGMIYIKPASAYLRSSFVASSLQRDSGSFDNNLLTHRWIVDVPFVGWLYKSVAPEERRRARYQRVRNDIDKQNWQTINRVKVKGTGQTNYVLVKDDIGNWYVKNYSAKPDKIIESTKNLLLFSAGALPQESLLSKLGGKKSEDSEKEDDTAIKTSLKPKEEQSNLEKLVTKQQTSYIERSFGDLAEVRSWYPDKIPSIVKQQLESACEASSARISDDLEIKRSDLIDDVEFNKLGEDKDFVLTDELTKNQEKISKDIGNRIVNSLRDIKYRVPGIISSWLAKEDGQLCQQLKADGSDFVPIETKELPDKIVQRIKSELIKPFVTLRQQYVTDHSKVNLSLQEVLAD